MEETKETKEFGLRRNERGQIRDHKESDADIRENLQRRSHETESKSLPHKNRSTTPDERTRMRHEVAYPVRPGEIDCLHYLKTGLCSYGRSCHFNHPTHLRRSCKYFVRGACKYGSDCRFYHPMDGDGAEPSSINVPDLPMHQARTMDWRASESSGRLDERRHETGSSSRPEKRAQTRERGPRERVEDVRQRRDETVAGFKRARLERDAHDRQNIEKPRQRDIETQRKEDRLRVEQEMQGKHARDQQVLEEERLREIDRKRTESRMRLDQMQQTIRFNEAHGVEEALRELGMKRKEGDHGL